MKYFLFKLTPPRPDFMTTQTSAEVRYMKAHAVYWRRVMEKGLVAAFGPVADPSGGYGVGILELPDNMDPSTLTQEDPLMKTGLGFRVEVFPMTAGVVWPHRSG